VALLDMSPYVLRDYAPAVERARAVTHAAAGAHALLEQARANLEASVSQGSILFATLQIPKTIAFLRGDVIAFADGLADAALRDEVHGAVDTLAGELDGFLGYVKTLTPAHDIGLGEADFLRVLHDKEGFDVDVATLRRVAEHDLAANQAAIVEAAKTLDGSKPTAEVLAAQGADRPNPDHLIQKLETDVRELRTFVVNHHLASVPEEVEPEVRVTPVFMRFNMAFLKSAGYFEPPAVPSFFFVTPPEGQEQGSVLPKADLLFTTAHEVWPGHFLNDLYIKRNPSRILRSFCSYAMTEGWAHYAEQMMFEEGLGEHEAGAHIGQLRMALLRDVRMLVALGMQTGKMTPPEAVELFEKAAYLDHATAQQQAFRGLVDPLMGNYTMGKLVILKLREDYKKKVGAAFSLQKFHDEFLGYACAPLPVIRREMVGEGPILE
jgi:uncharacterized protein (DUF885 family)